MPRARQTDEEQLVLPVDPPSEAEMREMQTRLVLSYQEWERTKGERATAQHRETEARKEHLRACRVMEAADRLLHQQANGQS